MKILYLALAGMFGTLSRFAITTLVNKYFTFPFIWGTFFVNVLGCFLYGVVLAICIRHGLSDETRSILLIGFMGSFTTFSSMIFEANNLIFSHNWFLLAFFLFTQILLGIGALKLGLLI